MLRVILESKPNQPACLAHRGRLRRLRQRRQVLWGGSVPLTDVDTFVYREGDVYICMGNALAAAPDSRFNEPEPLVTRFIVCLEVFIPEEDRDEVDFKAKPRIENEFGVRADWSVRLLASEQKNRQPSKRAFCVEWR